MTTITEVFRNIGKAYGYKKVDADFSHQPQFSVKWERSYDYIDLHVSDYLRDAPVEVWEDLAKTIFRQLTSGEKISYEGALPRFVTAPEFSQKNRATFIRRKGYEYDTTGRFQAKVKHLVSIGLLPEDHNIEVVLDLDASDTTSQTSVLFRTIAINYKLEDVSDETLDAIIYYRYLVIEEQTRVFGTQEEPKDVKADFLDGFHHNIHEVEGELRCYEMELFD